MACWNNDGDFGSIGVDAVACAVFAVDIDTALGLDEHDEDVEADFEVQILDPKKLLLDQIKLSWLR